MNKSLVAVALAATSFLLPAAASAAPAVLIVDLDKVLSECTACKAATATLQGQIRTGQARAQALDAQLKPELQAIEAAGQALNGKEPDAALKKRAADFQARQQAAQAELALKQRNLESTQANVQQQIAGRVVLISEQVRVRRQADIVIGKNATLASNPAGDITAEVLAALNSQLPSVSVTPLPQQAAPTGR